MSQQKQLLHVAVRHQNSSGLPLGRMIQEKQVRNALFWVTAQRVVVIPYRRFGKMVKNPCWIFSTRKNLHYFFQVQEN
jgi:hypothetical protein